MTEEPMFRGTPHRSRTASPVSESVHAQPPTDDRRTKICTFDHNIGDEVSNAVGPSNNWPHEVPPSVYVWIS